MNNSLTTGTESKSSEESKIKQQPNYWRSQKGYKRKYQFREKRNYQVSEICVLLLLLNDHFAIELSQSLLRQSKVTKRLIRLKTLTKENEIINVEEFIRKQWMVKDKV